MQDYNQFLYFSLFGFLASFTAFIYFGAVCRDFLKSKKKIFDCDAISGKDSEANEFRIEINEIRNIIAKKKSLQEMQVRQVVSDINRLVARIETLTPDDILKISPQLTGLIKELENIRKD